MNSIEISTNISGKSYLVAPENTDTQAIKLLLKIGMPTTEKQINKLKNGAIYQAKSMGWIGDEYPYLDDKEDTDIQTNADNNEDISSNNSDNTSNLDTSTSSNNNDNNSNENNSDNSSSNVSQQNQIQYTTVPNLVGLDVETASKKMQESMISGNINYIYTANKNKNNIVKEQSLKVGSKVETWEVINITAYKYDISELYVSANFKLICKNMDQEKFINKGLIVKVNDEEVISTSFGYWNFFTENLDFSYQMSLPFEKFSNNLKVEVYIDGNLIKKENVEIGSIADKEIKDYNSYRSININDISIDITGLV